MANMAKNEPNRRVRFKHRAQGPKASGRLALRTRTRKREIPEESTAPSLKVSIRERVHQRPELAQTEEVKDVRSETR